MSKHDNIVRNLVQRLKDSYIAYDYVGYEEEYYSRKTGHGECDVYAVYKNNLLCFEVKSTDTKSAESKAKHQLDKDKCYFGKKYHVNKVYKFYVYGEGQKNRYEIRRIK